MKMKRIRTLCLSAALASAMLIGSALPVFASRDLTLLEESGESTVTASESTQAEDSTGTEGALHEIGSQSADDLYTQGSDYASDQGTQDYKELSHMTGSGPYTSNNGTTFYMPVVTDFNQRVFDYADLFSDSDEKTLLEKLAKVEKEKNCEVMIITSLDVPEDAYYGTETTQKYTEQFYMDNADQMDGFIFMIDMKNNVLWTAGHGKYKDKKYVDFASDVYDEAMPYLRDRDFYGGANAFLTELHKLENLVVALIPTFGSVIVSSLLALAGIVILLSKHKSSQPVNNAKIAVKTLNYRQAGHRAIFLGTRKTSRAIPKSSGSGGGGGFSGGTSSGGGFSGGGSGFSGGGGHF